MAHTRVDIVFSPSSYDANGFYLRQRQSFYTDKDGKVTARLWVNELGDVDSRYSVYSADGDLLAEFILPNGTSTIPLTALVQGGSSTVAPQATSLITYLVDAIPNDGVYQALAITTVGQTSFVLSVIPSQPHRSRLYLNGVKQRYGVDYVINSTTLTWQGVRLAPTTDTLEIYYL